MATSDIEKPDLPIAAPDVAAEVARWLASLADERRMSAKTVEAYGRDVRQFLAFLGVHLGGRISLATLRTSTGFNSNQFQYSLDGVAFINFGAPYTPQLTFGLVTFDLSSIAGLNDNPNAAFRIVFNGATSASGKNRIDNLVVEGQSIATPIPEPASMLLLSLGLTATLAPRFKAWRRRARHRRDYHVSPIQKI